MDPFTLAYLSRTQRFFDDAPLCSPASGNGPGGDGTRAKWSRGRHNSGHNDEKSGCKPKRLHRPNYNENTRDKWSGRVDSNHRPPGPEPGALARLSHAPNSTSVAVANPSWTSAHPLCTIKQVSESEKLRELPAVHEVARARRRAGDSARICWWRRSAACWTTRAARSARAPPTAVSRLAIEARVQRALGALDRAFAAARHQRHRRGAAHQSGPRAAGPARHPLRAIPTSNTISPPAGAASAMCTPARCSSGCWARPASRSTTMPPPFSWR